MKPPGERPALLLVVSGPAGSGKTTLCERMLREIPGLQRIVTATTRPPRGEERDGVDYHFLSREEFEDRVARDEFFEWARVHDHLYGSLKSEVTRKLARGEDLLLNIDVQGAATLRRSVAADKRLRDRMVSVFVTPESIEVIRERLEGRGEDSPGDIERRLKNAAGEIRHWIYYDYCILSADRESDFVSMRSIYHAEKLRNRNKPPPESA